jgi:hypothetical protein
MPPLAEPNLQQNEPKSIIILQINLNKLEKAHLDLINEKVGQKYDILLIQEPHVTSFNKIRMPANFRQVFPSNMAQEDALVRSVIWVNKRLNTKDWDILEVPGTNDITAIQLKGPYGKLAIFNMYNDCTLPDPPKITAEQLNRHIHKSAPYKAHGPDDIPNVVIQRCAPLIHDRLIRIYQAVLDLNLYYDPWKVFTTVVLRKPNKPSYVVPKAYRPIALLSSMAKVLTSLVAEIISNLVETHNLLPKNHFGGRPGRTTTDAIQYLVHKIKDAWRDDQVVSVLFLNVEGAFPNAVTSRLLHNLKKR